MFELLIKNKGSWHKLDIEQDGIAFNVANYDINSISEISANYSQNIALPLTTNNVQALDYIICKHATVKSYRQYIECLLLADGINIGGEKSVLKLISIDAEAINVQVLSSLFDIATELKNIDLKSEYEDREKDPIGVITLPLAELTDSDAAKYVGDLLLGDAVQMGATYKVSDKNKGGFYERAMPLIPMRYIMQRILGKIGYTYDASFDDSNTYIALKDKKAWIDRHVMFKQVEDFWYSYWHEEDDETFIDYQVRNLYNVQMGVNPTSDDHYIALTMYAYGAADADRPESPILQKQNFISDVQQTGDAGIVIRPIANVAPKPTAFYDSFQTTHSAPVDKVRHSDALYHLYQFFDSWGAYELVERTSERSKWIAKARIYIGKGEVAKYDYHSDEWHIEKDMHLSFSSNYLFCEVGFTPQNGGELEVKMVYPDSANLAMPAGELSISNNLGFNTANDFLHFYCQTWNAFVELDELNKIVHFKQLNYIETTSAVDVSSLYVEGSESIEINATNYARNNIISLKENSKSGQIDSTTLLIDDDTLAKEKTIITISAETQPQGKVLYYTKDNDNRIVFKALNDCSILVLPNLSLTEQVQSISTIADQYKVLENLLGDYYQLTCTLLVDAFDIIKLSSAKIVYLKQYAAYFYVNKINDFQNNQGTEVELIRLK